jgi:hypothetical protein
MGEAIQSFIERVVPIGGALENLFIEHLSDHKKFMVVLESCMGDFERCQKETLTRIIRNNEGTRWGRDHGFVKLNSENWGEGEVVNYDSVKPYVDRIKKGDLHALTYELPYALAVTSGTTSEPKFVPITEGSFQSQNIGGLVWKGYLFRLHKRNLENVWMLNGGEKSKDVDLLPIKSYTDIIRERHGALVKRRFIYPEEAEEVTDLEHRMLIGAQQAFVDRPGGMISVNPLTVLRMLDLVDENRTAIGRAVEKGVYVGTEIPFELEGIRDLKDRQRLLDRVYEGSPLESVKFLGTWLGGTQNLFISELKNRGVDILMRDLGYIATEGRFTIPLIDNTPTGVLNPFGVYYEFMTLDKKEMVPMEGLERGGEYNLVVTTEGGLYRYDMEDVVQFQGYEGTIPRVSFRRKDQGFSSLTGEKLHENHVVDLFGRIGLEGKGFLVAEKNPPHYALVVGNGRVLDSVEVDRMLQDINPEYKGKRDSERLGSLEMRRVTDWKLREIDGEVNPRQEHDRFKRSYLISLDRAEKLGVFDEA